MCPLGHGFMRMVREGLVVTRDAFGQKVLCHFPHGGPAGSSVLCMTSLVNQSPTTWAISDFEYTFTCRNSL